MNATLSAAQLHADPHLLSHNKFSSASYRRRRCRPAAAACCPLRATGWGPPSSQSPGWCPPADRGWARCPSSWENSHRSERRRWTLEILSLCWLHLNYASGWTSSPWHLDSRREHKYKTMRKLLMCNEKGKRSMGVLHHAEMRIRYVNAIKSTK